jgi:hypothetical protein
MLINMLNSASKFAADRDRTPAAPAPTLGAYTVLLSLLPHAALALALAKAEASAATVSLDRRSSQIAPDYHFQR